MVRSLTVAIWTFKFHEKSGSVYLVDLEGKFQTDLQAKLLIFGLEIQIY